ncbi:hypothetical protein D3C72_1532400 [compost metagenome]
MRVDADVHRLVLQSPLFARRIHVHVHDGPQVVRGGSEGAAAAELAVIADVDDEGGYLAVAQHLARGQRDFLSIGAQGDAVGYSFVFVGDDAKLDHPAIHGVAHPVVVGQHGHAVRAPRFAP